MLRATNTTKNSAFCLVAVAASLLLSVACGGGGSGGNEEDPGSDAGALSGTFQGSSFPVGDAISGTTSRTIDTGAQPPNPSSITVPQTAVIMTTGSDACGRLASGTSVENEQRFSMFVFEVRGDPTQPSAATGPGTFLVRQSSDVGVLLALATASQIPPADQPARLVTVSYEGDDSSCNASATLGGVSGTVTITAIDGTGVTGTFDVTMENGDHVTGSFDAPHCDAVGNPGQGGGCVDGGLEPLAPPSPTPTPINDVACYGDSDGDGLGDPATQVLAPFPCPPGYVENGDDCDDTDGSVGLCR